MLAACYVKQLTFSKIFQDPESFARGVPTRTPFFEEGREDPNERIQIPLEAGHHRRADDGPTLHAGLVAL